MVLTSRKVRGGSQAGKTCRVTERGRMRGPREGCHKYGEVYCDDNDAV